MGYHADLALTAAWLESVQRPDGGWGLAPGQASSLVNTAEAIFVLSRLGGYEASLARGYTYISANAFSDLDRLGPRVRYIAFSLFAMSLLPESSRDKAFVERCARWLIDARNPDGAWGIESRDDASHLFSTSIALWSLQGVKHPDSELRPAYQWLLSQATDTGWSLRGGQGPSPIATAYAALVLAPAFASHDRLRAAKALLLQVRQWGTEEEVVAGTVWKHCTFAFVLPALMALEESPYSTAVAEAIRYVNTLRLSGGGWSESEPKVGQTIRAQFWSVLALDAVYRAFDPAIHTLRIDAERAEGVLTEPAFVKMAVHSKWAMIVPARLYILGAYTPALLALLVLLGMHRGLSRLVPRADPLIALALLGCTYYLIKKRKRYFPLAGKILEGVLAVLSLLSLVFGTDLETVFTMIKNKVQVLPHFIRSLFP